MKNADGLTIIWYETLNTILRRLGDQMTTRIHLVQKAQL